MKNKFEAAGKRIAELRGSLTQAEFAARIEVDRKTVVRWEAGERLPDGASLLALMSEFGADVNYILTGQEQEPSHQALLPEDERIMLDNYRHSPLAVQAGVKTTLGAFAPEAGVGKKRKAG